MALRLPGAPSEAWGLRWLREFKERFGGEIQLIAEDHLPQEKYILLDK